MLSRERELLVNKVEGLVDNRVMGLRLDMEKSEEG
jgi:hypothetical protein